MRTALDIDEDVLQTAKQLAAASGRPVGQVLSELARRGLAVPSIGPGNGARRRNGVPVLPSRGEIITLEHVNRLRDGEGA